MRMCVNSVGCASDWLIVGNPNRKKMHIFGLVGIFEYICKTTFNIIFSMYTKP